MDVNDLTPYQRDLLARALSTPAIREALDFLGPLDLRSTLRLARDLVRLEQEQQRAIHFIHTLRTALRQPGALDRLRARRAEPWARDLLLVAYRLGLMDGPRNH
jgi:hypothetical protein